MKLYKLTDKNAKTHTYTQWEEGVKHSKTPIDDPTLCTSDVIHAYLDPDLALLMNPAHANYSPMRLWEAEGEPCVTNPDKLGCFELTTVAELPLPDWYLDEAKRVAVQRRFAMLAVHAVLDVFESQFPNDKRPRQAIEAAERYLNEPTEKNRQAADSAAYTAAGVYASAAAASHAAAAYAAASHAYADHAAAAAAYASASAHAAAADLDLTGLAREAVRLTVS